MNPGKAREDFLMWHKENLANLIRCGELAGARSFESCKPLLELAWQASRESLVIELPKQHPMANTAGDMARGIREATRLFKSAIEIQGLKVK